MERKDIITSTKYHSLGKDLLYNESWNKSDATVDLAMYVFGISTLLCCVHWHTIYYVCSLDIICATYSIIG